MRKWTDPKHRRAKQMHRRQHTREYRVLWSEMGLSCGQDFKSREQAERKVSTLEGQPLVRNLRMVPLG